MRLFSKMLTRKPTEEEAMGNIDLDADLEKRLRRDEAEADDSGQVNPTRKFSSRAQTAAADPFDAVPSEPITPRSEEPEEAEGAGWGDNAFASDADWDDDDDWGEAEDVSDDNALKDDIRGAVNSAPQTETTSPTAIGSVGSKSEGRPWTDDQAGGRRAIARSRIGSQVDGSEDRLMSETNNKFGETESTRRRSALAHLKRAAAATKADKVLSHVVGRDASGDPEEQSPYRDDLAKVVRPQSGSRPISRPVTKDQTIADAWDEGTSDEDAAMFAAASEQSILSDSAGEADTFDPHAHIPANLSAEDFAEDEGNATGDDNDVFTGNYQDEFDDDDAPAAEADNAFDDDDFDEDFDDDFDEDDGFDATADAEEDDLDDDFDDDVEDDDGPVPSTAVAEAIAIANGEMDFEDDDEDDDAAGDDEAVRSQLAGIGGVATRSGEPDEEPESFVNVAAAVPTPAVGRPGRGAGRVKTRLLGFQPEDDDKDIFEAAKEGAGPAATEFPVGWIVVLEGPGRGKCFTLFTGVSNIGRGEDQAVRLDFGDTSISRNNHAAVAFDVEQGSFFLGHGGKSNLVRLNGKPVLSTEEMSNGDTIRIGETTLKFVALCGPDFGWTGNENDDQDGSEA